MIIKINQPNPEQKLATWRNTASLPKAEFCRGLIHLGILSTEDAVSASRGNWPVALEGFLSYLTPEQSAQIQIEWATRVQIHRMNIFVLLLASYLGLSDDTVDTLFGRNVT